MLLEGFKYYLDFLLIYHEEVVVIQKIPFYSIDVNPVYYVLKYPNSH